MFEGLFQPLHLLLILGIGLFQENAGVRQRNWRRNPCIQIGMENMGLFESKEALK